jgi:hypothetical protein
MSIQIYTGGLKNKFLGEGSYGCVFKPGISCNDKPVKKNLVTKISEINYYSKNEIEVSNFVNKKANKYNIKYRFSPIINNCKVDFNKIESQINLNKCEEFLQNIRDTAFYTNTINNSYFLMHSKFVSNVNIFKYLTNITNPSIYINEYIYSFYYLLNSIRFLYKINVCHNDLQNYNNVLYNINKHKPIIIDYGLSYKHKNIYKKETYNIFNRVDLKTLKKFYFSYRKKDPKYLVEKRFLSYILYNKQQEYSFDLQNNEIFDLKSKNILTKKLIELFIDDIIDAIYENEELLSIYYDNEINVYKKFLEEYYMKFLDTKKYPDYNTIVIELLPIVFEYSDLFSLSYLFTIINIVSLEQNKTQIHPFVYFINQLIKKSTIPHPDYRINVEKILKIIKFIINYINKFDIGKSIDDIYFKDYISKFYELFLNILSELKINHDNFFKLDFAYIDIELIFTKKNIEFIKNSNIKI